MPAAPPGSVARQMSDRLLGPGATRPEIALALGSALVAASLLLALARVRGLGWSTGQSLAAAVLAFDLVGGVAVNASAPARRYYFGPGRGPASHLGFVAAHLAHVAVFAWLFREGDWSFAAALSLGLLGAAGVVLAAPGYLRRPVAMLALTLGVVLSTAAEPAPGMEWFVPVLLLKLIVCYLLGDVPAAPRPAPSPETAPRTRLTP
jgi:hypothetical protein